MEAVQLLDLPHELLINILSYLSFTELLTYVVPVCRRLRDVCQDHSLRLVLDLRAFPKSVSFTTMEQIIESSPRAHTVVLRAPDSFLDQDSTNLVEQSYGTVSSKLFCSALLSLSHLTTLCIPRISFHSMEGLVSWKLVHFPRSLQHLNISGSDEADSVMMKKLVKSCPHLQSLDVSNCYYFDIVCLDLITELTSLTYLNLLSARCSVYPKFPETFTAVTTVHSDLKSLSFSLGSGFVTQQFPHLSFSSLTELNIEIPQPNFTKFKQLIHMLAELQALSHITALRVRADKDSHWLTVTELYSDWLISLGHNLASTTDICFYCCIVKDWSKFVGLTYLCLQGLAVCGACLHRLVHFSHKSLEKVVVTVNTGAWKVRDVLKSLFTLPRLRVLSFHMSRDTNPGHSANLADVPWPKHLRYLELGGQDLVDSVTIETWLSSNHRLSLYSTDKFSLFNTERAYYFVTKEWMIKAKTHNGFHIGGYDCFC